MSIADNSIPEDIRQRYDEIRRIRETRRTQKEIISDLTSIIKDFSKETFLPSIYEMLDNIKHRNELEEFKYLKSPMKQLVYLIDLYFSVEIGGNKDGISDADLTNITMLLGEIEMSYFGEIGFFNGNNDDSEKISVSLLAFLDYFCNAQMSYEEQTLERFERICGAFDNEVKRCLGFSIMEAKIFCTHIRNISNKKLSDCNYYLLNPSEWKKLTAKFKERGITDPKLWIDEPELALYKEYLTKPGCIFIHNIDTLKVVNLSIDVINKLLNFLIYPENLKKGQTVYYADKNPYFDSPLINLNNIQYLCPHHKFLIECFYNRINALLSKEIGEKYTQFRNRMLEAKVIEVFKNLFGKKAQFFCSYYFDKDQTEQDILIKYNKICLIIEVKDSQFRAPMRDPIKAYEKIKSDFKKSIQYGYDQCKRVEKKICENNRFKIYDLKSKKELYEIIPSRINGFYSIVVTQFKYGGIQTNLENLLIKEEDALYPWSVSVDDLEAFVLILKKLRNNQAANHFIGYLEHREGFHERLICSDELELCGYFINDKENFKKYAHADEIFTTFSGMADMFDAEYHNGLGFENEIDIDVKKYIPVPAYSKNYAVNTFYVENLLNDK